MKNTNNCQGHLVSLSTRYKQDELECEADEEEQLLESDDENHIGYCRNALTSNFLKPRLGVNRRSESQMKAN